MTWEDAIAPGSGWINPRLGIRFDEAGRFLPEAGNTVVCQIIPGSRTETALAAFRTALSELPEAHLFAFTPKESWHMTVFEGVVETRRDPAFWPQGIDPETALPATTVAMAQRLEGFVPPPPLRMAVQAATPFGLSLRGATAVDEGNARLWRDRLSDALRLKTPRHAEYAFHTTIAYLKRAPSRDALPVWRATISDWTRHLMQDITEVELAPPAFCTFKDMCNFAPLRRLG